MTIVIGNRGYVKHQSSAVGASGTVETVSFTGRATAGGVDHPQFKTEKKRLVSVIDMNERKSRLAEFSDTGATNGELTQLDTGPSGHTIWASFMDTGVGV